MRKKGYFWLFLALRAPTTKRNTTRNTNTMQDGRWRFALNGSNLTDEEYLQAGCDFGAAINYISQLGFYGAPRTWSVSATFTY